MSKWSPQNDNPALTLAAIRWYAISLEKLAMDLYATRKDNYPEVKHVLSEALKKLAKLRNSSGDEDSECDSEGKKKKMNYSEDDGCAPGYVNCNGVCLPDCDRIYEY